jgi:large subunit ribosomal protein L25
MVAELVVEGREATGKEKMKKLRAAGLVPGVIYGHGAAGVMIQAPRPVINKFLAKGDLLVSLSMPGGVRQAILKEVQIDPVTRAVVHLDFQEVRADEQVTVSVELKLRGTAAGIKEGGVVAQEMHTVDVSCIPSKIPSEIVVEISNLSLGGAVRVKELPLPEGVVMKTDGEQVVVNCRLPLVEEAPAPEEAAAAPAAPEVITERKEEEEAPEAGAEKE